jgi:hypothetical protein
MWERGTLRPLPDYGHGAASERSSPRKPAPARRRRAGALSERAGLDLVTFQAPYQPVLLDTWTPTLTDEPRPHAA